MSRFVLTAQLQLQAPTNVGQVVRQIQSQLNNVQVNVQVQGTQQAQRQLNQVTNATNQASSAAERLGRTFGLSIKRFAAFAVATRAVSLFTNSLSKAVEEAISFERELIKISQVTGKSISQLRDLTDEIGRLSTGLGVSSTSLLNVSKILSQAGLNADETRIALDALAKSELAPTFDNIQDTAEGVVAIFNQFRQGAEALEQQLGSINAVAGRFAVEAGDLIGVVRRVGGVFQASGGDLNELLALFTSVRATTRESAESIATGLRTIFTRIQRPKTIEFLRQYGVELIDLEGKFVGPFEATRRLSEALAGLEQGDITFIRIAEELGGFRQIGKVIPLLQQFRVAQEALNVAQQGSGSLADDAAKAQAALAVRITKVKEQFLELVRSITETTAFQLFANTALSLAEAFIKLADALKPVLPLLAAVAGFRLATGLGSFVRGIGGGLRTPRGFAKGGLVPGSGNRDTVPAMLTPGEFVIRKSSVNKLGAGNLAAMNNNKYAAGGEVVLRVKPNEFGGLFLSPPNEGDSTINSPQGRLVKQQTYSQAIINKIQNETGLIETPGKFPSKKGKETRLYSATSKLNKPNKAFASFLKQRNFDPVQVNKGFKTITPELKSAERDFLDTNPKLAKLPRSIRSVKIAADSGSVPSLIASKTDLNTGLQDEVTAIAYSGFKKMVSDIINSPTLSNKIGPERLKSIRPSIKRAVSKQFNDDPKGTVNSARAAIEGYLLEGIIGGVAQIQPASSGAIFDILKPGTGDQEGWSDLYGSQSWSIIKQLEAADAKRSATPTNKNSIIDKIGKYLAKASEPINKFATIDVSKTKRAFFGGLIKKFATGGNVGTDTVPALLTPGEFVINRQSAQKIGYGSLNRMNKVGKYAKGGIVQKFAAGGQAGTSGGGITGIGAVTESFIGLSFALQALTPTIDETSTSFQKFAASSLNAFNQLASTLMVVTTTLSAFGVQLSASTIMSGLKNLKNLVGAGKGGLGDILGGFQRRKGLGGNVAVSRTHGESVGESFRARIKEASPEFLEARKQRAAAIRSQRSSPFQLNESFADRNKRIFAETKSLNLNRAAPKSLTGKLGSFLGKKAAGGGISGRIAGFAGQAISKVGGLAGGALGGLGGSLGSLAAAAAGPIAAFTGLAAIANSIVGSFRDLDGRLNDAIKAQDIETASRLALAKSASEFPLIGNIVGAIFGEAGDEFLVGISNFFGGDSSAQIKSAVANQIQGAKAQKALAEASEKTSRALKEFEDGTASATDVLKASSQATKEALAFSKTTDAQIAANEANKSTGAFAVARDVFSLNGLLFENSKQRNRRIDTENEGLRKQSTEAEKAALQAAMPGIMAIQRQVAATGGSYEDFTTLLKREDPSSYAILLKNGANDVKKSFENIAKEAERTRKAFDAMNLGFQNVAAVSGALTLGLNNYLASQEAGYSGLNNTIATLEASITSAAQGISDDAFGSALGDAAANLRKLGASDDQITKFTENLTAINTAQKFYAQASAQVKDQLVAQFQRGAGANMSSVGKRETFSKVITDQLAGAGIGEEVRKRISSAIEGADIAEGDLNKILEGDLSVLDKVLKDLGETTLNQVIGPLQELAKYNQELANITKKRLDLENQVVNSQKALLDAQLEAQEIIAKYGGPAVTPEIRRQNILAQANVEGQAAGIGNLQAGTGAELNARSAQIRGQLSQISAIRQQAAQEGPAGDVARAQLEGESGVRLAEQEKRLQELAKSDYDTTKKLIQQKEDELKIIGEKNKAEKAAIESLLAGDIEKYFEQQAAVGATAALASGNQTLINAFGAKAVGAAALDIQRQQEAGVQTLYGQQVGGAGGLAERAFGSALAARGVSSTTMAQVAAGSTPEEEAAKSEIRELAATLPNYAQTQLEVAQSGLEVANIQYTAAQMQLEAAKANAKARGVDIAGMAKGGVVYANRGIFVPRGTDTVPAMLTPGEFVVRREAVRRGNNLQLLKAMNNGQGGVSNSGAAVGMARGGVVRYYDGGAKVDANNGGVGFGISPEIINKLAESLNDFNTKLQANIEKLNNTTVNVKLDPTNVNVTLVGTSFLGNLKDSIKSELLREIGEQLINDYKVVDGGRIKKDAGVK